MMVMFLKKIKLLVTTLTFLIIFGCMAIGDAVLLIEGEIEEDLVKYRSCKLSIGSGKKELSSFDIKQGKFRVDYTIEPRKREYVIGVFCLDKKNSKRVLKEQSFSLGAETVARIDLGVM